MCLTPSKEAQPTDAPGVNPMCICGHPFSDHCKAVTNMDRWCLSVSICGCLEFVKAHKATPHKMTIEEAHIKATLEFGEDYHSNVYVQLATVPGDDPTPSCEIMVMGDYDGDWALGRGATWEDAFYDANWEIAKSTNDLMRHEQLKKDREAKILKMLNERNKTNKQRRLEKKQRS